MRAHHCELEAAAEAADSTHASTEGASLGELAATVWRGAGPGGCQFLGRMVIRRQGVATTVKPLLLSSNVTRQ